MCVGICCQHPSCRLFLGGGGGGCSSAATNVCLSFFLSFLFLRQRTPGGFCVRTHASVREERVQGEEEHRTSNVGIRQKKQKGGGCSDDVEYEQQQQ
ncbi:hypothetical protein TRSC58_07647 [Trypanosoma rangeli SC58]|uniref:Uncharacterized protein n=1 Tax=Trypanosoma rangeli SC58 TaxID=429131 RepID=A0A061IRR0_TRYRA|nr:hypothetical protein TRSC58_07647 [Trypanosoma rangeli SC58]